VHMPPQLFTLKFERQLPLHKWVPAPQVEHRFPEQYALVQSAATAQPTPFAQVFPWATQTPPQSTPVSL